MESDNDVVQYFPQMARQLIAQTDARDCKTEQWTFTDCTPQTSSLPSCIQQITSWHKTLAKHLIAESLSIIPLLQVLQYSHSPVTALLWQNTNNNFLYSEPRKILSPPTHSWLTVTYGETWRQVYEALSVSVSVLDSASGQWTLNNLYLTSHCPALGRGQCSGYTSHTEHWESTSKDTLMWVVGGLYVCLNNFYNIGNYQDIS